MGGSLRCLFLIMLVFFASNASAKGARKVKILLHSKLFTKVIKNFLFSLDIGL